MNHNLTYFPISTAPFDQLVYDQKPTIKLSFHIAPSNSFDELINVRQTLRRQAKQNKIPVSNSTVIPHNKRTEY